MSQSWASALTFVLTCDGTACTSHINSPVYIGARDIAGFAGTIPVRVPRDGGPVDVWEVYSDADQLSTQWVQMDGSPIPAPPDGSFGWALDYARSNPGEHVRPVGARIAYLFQDGAFRLVLPNGMKVRPSFPAREMRAVWEIVGVTT